MIENNRYYWSHLKTKTTTVRVSPKRPQKGVIFRISNMIDLGGGRQTVMLEHVDYPKTYDRRKGDNSVDVPFCMGDLDFVYTSKEKPKVQNVHNLLSTLYKGNDIEKIVAEVLSPGDLIIFKQEGKTMKVKMIETLRIVKENTYKKNIAKKSNVNNAL